MKHTMLLFIGMAVSALSYAADDQALANKYVASLNKELFGSFDIRILPEQERGSLQQVISDAAISDTKLVVFKFTHQDKDKIKEAEESRDTRRILVAHLVTKAMLSKQPEKSMALTVADDDYDGLTECQRGHMDAVRACVDSLRTNKPMSDVDLSNIPHAKIQEKLSQFVKELSVLEKEQIAAINAYVDSAFDEGSSKFNLCGIPASGTKGELVKYVEKSIKKEAAYRTLQETPHLSADKIVQLMRMQQKLKIRKMIAAKLALDALETKEQPTGESK